ncbi:hypothetical protein A5844_000295 [Enterococcus sp. 10A9_DIV0425]|uniref:Uncharacterized protein n=1 Tax=Candidatus Enterococcus wittei TaxID=1987383 RepID=A0A2C9XPH6_9ENTE|nr:hypothetical protein [Enterococcus sp. 10A9_DIV0425]OTP12080.1 hypothetical protein A5844_000295 [Enterococcus sp. 10A9_DIV0425]THE07904.1 hypothetical protein E1H99_12120 [Enterococcus hirae]
MDYHTRKLLGLTDENIIFPTNWLSEKKEGGIIHFRDRIYLIQGLVFQDQSKTKKNQSKHISTSIDSR